MTRISANNDEYQAYVRRVSFDISLTGPQCMLLVMLLRKMNPQYGHFVPVIKGLIRKGFVMHTFYKHVSTCEFTGREVSNTTGIFSGKRPAYELTKEGKLTAQLIELAGIPEIENLVNMVKVSP